MVLNGVLGFFSNRWLLGAIAVSGSRALVYTLYSRPRNPEPGKCRDAARMAVELVN